MLFIVDSQEEGQTNFYKKEIFFEKILTLGWQPAVNLGF